ncbi:mediator of RNA polymerase II transcription subunit 31 [Aphis craccivora]|uniref:Mediator of RNA polymerase II transcription subunit 31 n=1 Tax=Aphis craccivora TaxID=307492 RepID=A0A6G0Z6X7_APHCR|nr:mediator of RNA polymerase II transcription subunit 31 [Aphis craccivora]
MANKGGPETEEQTRLRFQVELEFVQCLANPNYLNFLAQRGYFKDQSFINYLKYLLYWKEPDYAKFIKYPMCLYFLDLLQHEPFRKEIATAICSKFIDDQLLLIWQHYTRRRTKLIHTAYEHNMNMMNKSGTSNIGQAQTNGTNGIMPNASMPIPKVMPP